MKKFLFYVVLIITIVCGILYISGFFDPYTSKYTLYSTVYPIRFYTPEIITLPVGVKKDESFFLKYVKAYDRTGEEIELTEKNIIINKINFNKKGTYNLKVQVGFKSKNIDIYMCPANKVSKNSVISQEEMNKFNRYSNIDIIEDELSNIVNVNYYDEMGYVATAHGCICIVKEYIGLNSKLVFFNYLIKYYQSHLTDDSDKPLRQVTTTIDNKTYTLPFIVLEPIDSFCHTTNKKNDYVTRYNAVYMGLDKDSSEIKIIDFFDVSDEMSYDEFVRAFEKFIVDSNIDPTKTYFPNISIYGSKTEYLWEDYKDMDDYLELLEEFNKQNNE